MLPGLTDLESAAAVVYRTMSPTPQYSWPLLNERVGIPFWLKHENHTPLGAFKVRGGLVYFDSMSSRLRQGPGVICATRGNHGQSVAFAAGQYGIPAVVVVPKGNSREKNAAMRGFGAKLIEEGDDFQSSLDYAESLAKREGLIMVPSFDPLLVAGVGTYSLELLRAVPDLDVLFVPIGLGSGICGAIAAKRALDVDIEIVGVVSSRARAYSESFRQGRPIELPVSTRIADGMACRCPNVDALKFIQTDVSRIIEVEDEEVEQAIRDIYECTHNVAEGAGAAAVAAIKKDAANLSDKKVAGVLCGANIDTDVFARILATKGPS